MREAKILILLILLACANSRLFTEENSVIFLRSVDSTTLEPSKSEEFYSSEVIANIFEGLVRFKKGTLEIEPCLATRWETRNNHTEWLFYLREGVRFHNNRPLDSDSVVSVFRKKLGQEKPGSKRQWFFFPYIEHVEAVEKYVFKITLKKPYAPLLPALTDSAALIVAPESYQKDGSFNPLGTGPFKFKSWDKGNALIIERNSEYWDKNARLSKVIFKVVQNPATRTLNLRNGNADILRINSAVEYEELLGRKDIIIKNDLTPDVHYLAFNTRKFPLSRVDVRKAFAHLINKQGLIKHVFQTMAVPAVTPIPPSLFGFNKSIKDYRFDIPRARELMKKAGLESGFSANLFIAAKNVGHQKIANIITSNAKYLNVRIRQIKLPFRELVRRCDKGEHDMVLLGWVGPPDPDFFLYPLFTMEPGNKNRAFYQNKRLSALLEKAKVTLNPELRLQYYWQAQEIIHEDLPWIPLFHQESLVAFRSNLENLVVNPNTYIEFKYLSKNN
ncbi:MAG: hypothetical protein JXA62_08640 [Candidatus Aminicenantes bacterium]|nr:hypothetical protein [Candidatus Aminicenantes bacterium]